MVDDMDGRGRKVGGLSDEMIGCRERRLTDRRPRITWCVGDGLLDLRVVLNTILCRQIRLWEECMEPLPVPFSASCCKAPADLCLCIDM